MNRRNFIKNLGIIAGSTLPRGIYAQNIEKNFEQEKSKIGEDFNNFEEKLSQEVNKNKPSEELTEQEKLDLAYETMDLIMQIPDQENAVSEGYNRILKGDVAQIYVYTFANQITGQDGRVTPKERKIALNYLVSPQVSQKIADKYAGNNDGKCDFEEMNGLNKLISKNPGLEKVMKMYHQSKNYKKL